jgi:hypothetical protein
LPEARDEEFTLVLVDKLENALVVSRIEYPLDEHQAGYQGQEPHEQDQWSIFIVAEFVEGKLHRAMGC